MDTLIHPLDQEILSKMLGQAVLPDSVVSEYVEWQALFHRGQSGPLGALTLVAMLRQLGIQAPKKKVVRKPVDWSKVPLGTKIVVEGEEDRLVGTYTGMVAGGTIGVQFEGDPKVHEVAGGKAHVYREPDPRDVPPQYPDGHPGATFEIGERVAAEVEDRELPGVVQKVRVNGDLEVAFEGDTKKFRIVKPQDCVACVDIS